MAQRRLWWYPICFNLRKVVFNTDVKHVILTRMGDQLSFGKRTLVNFVVKYIKKLVPKYKLPHAVTFREVLRVGKYRQYIRPEIGKKISHFCNIPAVQPVCERAMLTHGNMVYNIAQAKWLAEPFRKPAIIVMPPLFCRCITFSL